MADYDRSPKQAMPDTSWSLLRAAAAADHQALSRFIDLYRPALIGYLVRFHRMAEAEAEDAVHDFLERRVLHGDWLSRADPQRGRFRSFVFSSLRNFITDYRRSRRGRDPVVAAQPVEPATADGANTAGMQIDAEERAFDILWAQRIIELVFDCTRRRCLEAGQESYWLLFDHRVRRPALHDVPPTPYSQCVPMCGFSSVPAACNALMTVKRRLRRCLHDTMTSYCSADAIDDEINALLGTLQDNSAVFDRLADERQPDGRA